MAAVDRKGPPSALAFLWTGILAAWPFLVLDLVLAARKLGVGFEEVFLLRQGRLDLTIASYDFLFFAVAGLVVACGSYFWIRWRRKSFGAKAQLNHILVCFACLAAVFGVLRSYLYVINQGRSGGVVLTSLAGLLVFLMLVALILWLAARTKLLRQLYRRRFAVPLFVAFLSGLAASFLWPELVIRLRSPDRLQTHSEASAPNVLLIVMDTVRADYVSSYGTADRTTPNIDALARQGTLFAQAFSASAWTLPAHASMFSGLYPSQHGAGWEHMRLEGEYLTLAEYLGQLGYQTVGLSENPFIGKSTGMTQGFADFYRSKPGKEPIGFAVAEKLGRVFLRWQWTAEHTRHTMSRFRTWLLLEHEENRPFFAFLNLMPAHLPNYPRTDAVRQRHTQKTLDRIEPVNRVPELYYLDKYRLTEPELAVMRELYADELRFLDSQIGRLADFLTRMGMLDNTVLVVTSDHGENFGDHGMIEHQLCLYNTLLRVPLIIRFPPKVEAGMVIDAPVSTTFLFQAIAELIGAELDEGRPDFERRSLFRSATGEYIYSEYNNAVEMLRGAIGDRAGAFDFTPFDRDIQSIQQGRYKLILSSDGRQELYELVNDPEERENLIHREPGIAEELKKQFQRWQDGLILAPEERAEPELDPKTREALRALGYLE